MSIKTDFSGTWRNKYGSEVNLEVDDCGLVKGKFRTAVGRPELVDVWKDRWFDVIGSVNGRLIAFTINYGPRAKSLATVVGKLDEGKMETHSYVHFDLDDQDAWRQTVTNALTYERVLN